MEDLEIYNDFATYILQESDLSQKMLIVYYLSKKEGIFFDKSIILKVEIAKLFIQYMELNVDENLVLTAMLLCNCKKIENAQKIGKLETYAKEGAEYLAMLGFNKRFCKICEEVNRYSGSEPRERESDILEIVDQFTGLILNRVEREAFGPEEALVILKERNLKYVDNIYKELFTHFVKDFENIKIKEVIEVPVIKKLVNLHNKEANVKTFIAILTNSYVEKINNAIQKNVKKLSSEMLQELNNEANKVSNEKKESRRMKNIVNSNRALFSDEIAQKILNHTSKYKIGG